eukprot:3355142-Rhodomonas_salina.2
MSVTELCAVRSRRMLGRASRQISIDDSALMRQNSQQVFRYCCPRIPKFESCCTGRARPVAGCVWLVLSGTWAVCDAWD